MFKKSLLFLSFAVLTASLAFAEPEGDGKKAPEAKPKPHAFTMTDNSFSYTYGATYREPFVAVYDAQGNPVKAKNVAKNSVTFKHVDIGNKWGDNLFVMQYLMSNRQNPVSSDHYHDSLEVGAKDVYMTMRHNVSLSRLFPSKKFSFGPVSDVLITMGADFGVKNDDFSSQRRSPFIGPGLAFKVPNHGFATLSAMWTREWNNEGTDITSYWAAPNVTSPKTWGQPVVYDPSYSIQAAWGVPVTIGKEMVMFEGFGTFNGSKGYTAWQMPKPFAYNAAAHAATPCGTGTNPNCWYRIGTKPETLIHATVKYNVGKFFGEGHNWQIGAGYEWWNNKFGVDHKQTVPQKQLGTIANTPFVELTIHL